MANKAQLRFKTKEKKRKKSCMGAGCCLVWKEGIQGQWEEEHSWRRPVGSWGVGTQWGGGGVASGIHSACITGMLTLSFDGVTGKEINHQTPKLDIFPRIELFYSKIGFSNLRKRCKKINFLIKKKYLIKSTLGRQTAWPCEQVPVQRKQRLPSNMKWIANI